MKALVIGLGISGKSATLFLRKKGYEVVEFDDMLAPIPIRDIEEFAFVVLSPGVPPHHHLCLRAKMAGIPVKGEAQLALENTTQPCIGVTGTNGKTTVVKMIEHCLNRCGKKAKAVGNVGVALTSSIGGDEILVVELSSYQLETLTAQVFDAGVILNLAENHLDRYRTMDEYGKAKARLQFCMKPDGGLYVHPDFDPSLFSTPFQTYVGGNIEVAQLICAHFGVGEKEFKEALLTFSKPAHRIEFVAEIREVKYYNDSKGTSLHAVFYALDHLKTKVILLMGGQDKGITFEPLNAYRDQLTAVVVFGQAREKIANALQDCHAVWKVATMQEAVEKAKQLAKPGDTVLLSPGCASFDAFKNYEERGEEFKRLVRKDHA